jgi:hypothetical protein
MNDWNIKPRSETCSVTGRPFVESDTLYSSLFWKDGQYERIDLCHEAWEQRNENLQPLSFWKSVFVPAPAAEPEPLKKGDAESLLRKLLGENDPAMRNPRYILALMLERKRQIRPVDRRDEGGRTLIVYEHAATGETWLIEDPKLRLDLLEPVQTEVSDLLASSFAPSPVPAVPAAEPAT